MALVSHTLSGRGPTSGKSRVSAPWLHWFGNHKKDGHHWKIKLCGKFNFYFISMNFKSPIRVSTFEINWSASKIRVAMGGWVSVNIYTGVTLSSSVLSLDSPTEHTWDHRSSIMYASCIGLPQIRSLRHTVFKQPFGHFLCVHLLPMWLSLEP